MNQLQPHTLADIREVMIAEALAPVNHVGQRIEPPTIRWGLEHHQGWRCIACAADFRQWRAVLAHIKEPKRDRTHHTGARQAQ